MSVGKGKIVDSIKQAADKPPKHENNAPVTRPWVRYWARFLDNIVFGLFIAGLHGVGIISDRVILANPILLTMFLLFAWAVAEPIVLIFFGTTPGKALLNIKLHHKDAEKLSKVNVGILYKRSFAVWLKGLCFGFPICTAVTLVINYRNLKSNGETSWDHNGGFIVSHGKIGYTMGSITTVVIIMSMILSDVTFKKWMDDYDKSAIAQRQTAKNTEKDYFDPADYPSPPAENPGSDLPPISNAEAGNSEALQRSDRIKHLFEAKDYYGAIRESESGDYLVSESNIIGISLFATNQFDRAIIAFKEAERAYPSDPMIKSNLGDAYFSNGNFELARGKYQEALGLNPSNEYFQQRVKNAVQVESDRAVQYSNAYPINEQSNAKQRAPASYTHADLRYCLALPSNAEIARCVNHQVR